nr:MAG TPA: L SHAPED TAIL FIBER PROTEIN [Caudoviricetes sp.]
MKKPLNTVRKLSTVSEFTSSKAILSAALVVGGLQFSPVVSAAPTTTPKPPVIFNVLPGADNIQIGAASKYYPRNTDVAFKFGNKDIFEKVPVINHPEGVISFGEPKSPMPDFRSRQLQGVSAGQISETSSDAVNGSQLYALANATKGIYDDVEGIKKRIYTFNIANNEKVLTTNSGKADEWKTTADDTLTLGATDELSVTTDGSGKIVYGFSETSKKTMKEAKDAATTVTNSLTAINASVKKAEDAAKAAKDSETAAKSAETNAKASETAAQTAETNAKASETAAKTAETNAKASETAAKTSEDNAKDSETAAQTAETNAKASETSAKASENMTQVFAQTAEKARDEAVLAQNKVTAEANGIKRVVQSSNEQGEINKETATVDGRNSTAVGSSAQVQGDNSSAFGSQAKVVANKSVAVGQGARVLAENSVALGQGSVVDKGEINTVSVGNSTTKRRVTNVADGINAHDAVNVKQLNEVKSSVDSVRKDLQKNDKKLRGGIAGAAALANIPQVTQAGSNLLGVGVGNYRGESAVAVGYSKANESNKVIFKMSGSATTQGDFNVGAGIGYQW